MCRHLFSLTLSTVMVLLVGPARAADAPGLKEVLAIDRALQGAIEEAEPAIACIIVSRSNAYRKLAGDLPAPDNSGKLGGFPVSGGLDQKKYDLANRDYVPESYGSGVVVDEKGLILTNYHVVRDATKVYVRLPGDKGSYADIHAADPRSDLAVLRVLNQAILPLTAIKLGNGEKVRKGQLVLSLANPFAAGFHDGSPSASWGIISNIRRRAPGNASREEDQVRLTLHRLGTLLQTDARLNLGCSGGALIDLKGEFIGLTTSLAAISGSETAGGFAVPMDAGMRRIIDVLKEGKEVEYGFLGVGPDPLNQPGEGVQINSVTPGSPAAQAGLVHSSQILAINGVRINNVDELFLGIGTQLAGSEIKIEVAPWGQGPTRTVTARLAKFYVPGKIIASNKPPAVRGLRVDYVSALLLRDRLTAGQPMPGGVYVREVEPGSPAETARLQDAIITQVNGRLITTPAEFYQIASKVVGPMELTLGTSDGSPNFRKVKLD